MNRDLFEGWPGQYKRVLRWRDRAHAASRSGDADTAYDFIYAFFQSCYHMRDWLEATQASSKDDLRRLFEEHAELQLCRDICNAHKHLRYDHPSIDRSPRIAREWDPWTQTPSELNLYSDQKRPVGQLIDDCIRIWESFLREKKLLPS